MDTLSGSTDSRRHRTSITVPLGVRSETKMRPEAKKWLGDVHMSELRSPRHGRRMRVPCACYLALFSFVVSALASPPAGCEASPSTREILNRLAAPPDPREPAAARAARAVEVLRKAQVRTPRDTFL